jgi:hypothetical protein
VALAPPAIRALDSLPELDDREDLLDALQTELLNGPNAHSEVRFDREGSALSDPGEDKDEIVYTATPLTYRGYTVVHRELTAEELGRLGREQGRPIALRGFYVIDILSAESAFIRRPARKA